MAKARRITLVPPDLLEQAYALLDQGMGASAVWQQLLQPYMARRTFQDHALAHRREHGAALLRDTLSLCQALTPRLTRCLEKAAALETWSHLRGLAKNRDLSDSAIDELAAAKIKRLWPGIRVCPSGLRHWRERAIALGAFSDLARGAMELLGWKLQSRRGVA